MILPGFFKTPHSKTLIISSLAVNLLALALPMLTMQIYDRVMVNHAVDTLTVLSVGVFVAALFEFVLRLSRIKLVSSVGAKFEHEASVHAVEKLLQAEPRVYERTPKAIYLQNIMAVSRLKDYYGGQVMATLMVDLPFAVLLIGLSFYLSVNITLVTFAIISAFCFFSWRQGITLKAVMHQREKDDNRRYNFISQALQAVHTIKALCLEAVVSRRFEEVQNENGRINHRISSVQGATSTLGYTIGQLLTIAVICVGAPLVVQGKITVGILIACVMLSGQIMQPLQRGLGLWLMYQDVKLARDNLNSLLVIPSRNLHVLDELAPNHGRLKIDNVRFSYADGGTVLDGANLEIKPGEIISLQGASGAGKTTTLELIAGIYQPDRGSISVSGMEASRIPSLQRNRYIGYLPNRGLILRGSIMDNLSGFDAKQQNETKDVVELLGIEDAVALLPAGYDTPLEGLATDVIAPGLKQRIAMAHALINKPRLILYDNADQGLDRESYTRVFSLLAQLKGKATVILVSEDKNILSLADRAVELRRGQFIEVTEPATMLVTRSGVLR